MLPEIFISSITSTIIMTYIFTIVINIIDMCNIVVRVSIIF